ncbi:hypothetical protein QOT17_016778 [Balamuthia mandrillaris]
MEEEAETKEWHTLKVGDSIEFTFLSPTFTGVHHSYEASSADSNIVRVKLRKEAPKPTEWTHKSFINYVFRCTALKPGTTAVLVHHRGGPPAKVAQHTFIILSTIKQ